MKVLRRFWILGLQVQEHCCAIDFLFYEQGEAELSAAFFIFVVITEPTPRDVLNVRVP